MRSISFTGIVCTGQGCGKFFVGLPWVLQQLRELTGFTPYFGTLNLLLESNSVESRALLTSRNGLLVKPEKGYSSGYLYKARLFDVTCYVVLPDVAGYPENLFEIIAAENLRDILNVKDGDTLTILVTL